MHIDPEADLLPDAVCDAFAAWLANTPRDAAVCAVHDRDVDGLAAGLLWERFLGGLGFTAACVRMPAPGETLFSDGFARRVADATPASLFLLTLHPARRALLPPWPRHDLCPATVAWQHPPNPAWAVHALGEPLVSAAARPWVAALGTVACFGTRASFPFMREIKARYTGKHLQAVAELLAAALCHGNDVAPLAARAIEAHDTPRALMQSGSAEALALRAAAADVTGALQAAEAAQPQLFGRLAIIEIAAAAHIEALTAARWSARLPGHIVLAVNLREAGARYAARSRAGIAAQDFLRTLGRAGAPLPVGPDGRGEVTRGDWEAWRAA
jgi:hypothetical protein